MANEIDVSILCITYNQDRYISKSIDSFLMQEVDFKIEIIVADDFSTDKTRDIIRSYHEKYPDKIFPIFRDSNIGCVNNFKDAFSKARGKYISICEGDDYFIDKHKIQTQRDLMERHESCTLCFHDVKFYFETGIKKDFIFPRDKISINDDVLNCKGLLKSNFIQTNSVLYRNNKDAIKEISKINSESMPLDWILHLVFAKNGEIRYIKKCMSAYRVNEGGIWYDCYKRPNDHFIKNFRKIFYSYQEMLRVFNNEAQSNAIIYNHFRLQFRSLRLLKEEDVKLAIGNIDIKEMNRILIAINLDENRCLPLFVPEVQYDYKYRVVNFISRLIGLGKIFKKAK